ncbi:MAG: hypothetical protein O3A46_01205 [Candidatus Poribacteria bacterium]|nr:hypothetical protein [Candidatus Poribacteria bacterium]
MKFLIVAAGVGLMGGMFAVAIGIAWWIGNKKPKSSDKDTAALRSEMNELRDELRTIRELLADQTLSDFNRPPLNDPRESVPVNAPEYKTERVSNPR